MSLLRLYGLNEAPEKMISRQEMDRRYPEAMVAFDRDTNGSFPATFFVNGNMLYANTKGGGWMSYTSGGRDDDGTLAMGHWNPWRKPAQARGEVHSNSSPNDSEDVRWNRRFGGTQRLQQRVSQMSDQQLLDRLEQEEIWAQTVWPTGEDITVGNFRGGEPVLSGLIQRELQRRENEQ